MFVGRPTGVERAIPINPPERSFEVAAFDGGWGYPVGHAQPDETPPRNSELFALPLICPAMKLILSTADRKPAPGTRPEPSLRAATEPLSIMCLGSHVSLWRYSVNAAETHGFTSRRRAEVGWALPSKREARSRSSTR
jgi:hypothetical protein